MKGQHNRVGILASSALAQHVLESVMAEAGYEVAVNTSPERLNKRFLSNETIRVWFVELEEDDRWSAFLNEAIEQASAPLLFGDGKIPSKIDPEFDRWRRRLTEKLRSMAPIVEYSIDAPEINLDYLMDQPKKAALSLPEALKRSPDSALGPVWVLCASLGGPQAVKEFLDALPAELPAAFIYGQHIDAGCLDALVHSVGRHTSLTVVHAVDQSYLANGHVFVAPVDHEVVVNQRHQINLQTNGWSGPYGPSLDQLLENLAMGYGERCHCIIFSGMGNDGAIGASKIRAAGGVVWAQSAESCVESSMPDSASEAGVVDFRGSPVEMAVEFIRWLENTKLMAV